MSKFYSVKIGDKLKFKGCSCGYGLKLEDIVECVDIKLDKFFWVNPYNGEKRMTPMGSPCFELFVETFQNVEKPIKKSKSTSNRKKK